VLIQILLGDLTFQIPHMVFARLHALLARCASGRGSSKRQSGIAGSDTAEQIRPFSEWVDTHQPRNRRRRLSACCSRDRPKALRPFRFGPFQCKSWRAGSARREERSRGRISPRVRWREKVNQSEPGGWVLLVCESWWGWGRVGHVVLVRRGYAVSGDSAKCVILQAQESACTCSEVHML
jgi:hypothetical protein